MGADPQRQDKYRKFFARLREALRRQAPFEVEDHAPYDEHWINIGGYPRGTDVRGSLHYSFSQREKGRPRGFRVEFHIHKMGRVGNEQVRGTLHDHRDEMPGGVGQQVEWDDTDAGSHAQRIAIYYKQPGPIQEITIDDVACDESLETALIQWGVEKMISLRAALDAIWHYV